MSYLDDSLPDFSSLNLPDDGLIFDPSSSASTTPSTGNQVPTFLKAGGSVLSGIGTYMQGQEEAGADEYNASLALQEGAFNVQQLGEQETQALSTQKAMYAKAGVEQSGSVLDTALNTATQYEYSKQVAEFNAQSKANMDVYEANAAKSQGEMGLAGGLLQGAETLGLAALLL